MREIAKWLLPRRLNRQTDKELITHLFRAGYTLPPPGAPDPPASPAQPTLSPAQQVFHKMCEAGSTDEVRRRLQAGGQDVNEVGIRNRTPLFVAAQRGHLEVVELLVDYGADLMARTYTGRTAEDLAEKYHCPTVAAFLKTTRMATKSAGTAESSAS